MVQFKREFMLANEVATILLVEDDAGHARLIEKNLRRASVVNTLHSVDDGQKAVDFIFAEGEFAGQELPEALIVLLDLNLPVLDGYQVLERIKADERTKQIPVVILTTTDNPHEISRCYELGCNVYVTKPSNMRNFLKRFRTWGCSFL